MFHYRRRVQFYETDLMGIVHHANYLRFYEEARVAWAHNAGILDYQRPESAFHLAVVQTEVRHIKPAKFGDELEICVQARIEKVKIIFEYKMFKDNGTQKTLISEGRTVHAPLNHRLLPMRPPEALKNVLENSPWIETWLSNL